MALKWHLMTYLRRDGKYDWWHQTRKRGGVAPPEETAIRDGKHGSVAQWRKAILAVWQQCGVIVTS